MTRNRPLRRVLLTSALIFGVAALGAAQSGARRAGPPAPHAISMGGSPVSALGAFRWAAAGGADHYDFEIAADAAFNSPVLGSAGQM